MTFVWGWAAIPRSQRNERHAGTRTRIVAPRESRKMLECIHITSLYICISLLMLMLTLSVEALVILSDDSIGACRAGTLQQSLHQVQI
jgi:hypothetical protein